MSDDEVSDQAVRAGTLGYQQVAETPGSTLEDRIFGALKGARPSLIADHNETVERLVAKATKDVVEQAIANERGHADRWEAEAKAANRVAEDFRDLVNMERRRGREESDRADRAEAIIDALRAACTEAEQEGQLGEAVLTTETVRGILDGDA